MLKQRIIWRSRILPLLVWGSSAPGQVYEKLLDFEDHVRVGGDELEWLWTHGFEGTTAYCVVRGSESRLRSAGRRGDIANQEQLLDLLTEGQQD